MGVISSHFKSLEIVKNNFEVENWLYDTRQSDLIELPSSCCENLIERLGGTCKKPVNISCLFFV